MTGIEQGALIGGFMLLMLALRVHIGIAMLVAGSVGYIWLVDIGTTTRPLPTRVIRSMTCRSCRCSC